ncbi:GNAT family N-acetyltransferase [Enterobacteriaceae bacterium H4N4]|uniref:GNAT family N-acetyltransferase n=1 Tax=Silvania confinis TaxID=2926470 RepID=A0A9J6QA07_9ENTR|nr:GNAT family N-acetyltransferase [Silvania confinis]MCU6668584.1 GNAT family N-acetyltransferase [Silvania confinis]
MMISAPETSRVRLRQWRAEDLAPFAALNSDPEVMGCFPAPLSREESDGLAERFSALIDLNGWGFWALEEKASGTFLGTVGLHHQPDRFTFSPCTEIGWRLAKPFWHKGFACEAAKACLTFAFQVLALDEVVSFTSIHNVSSESLMLRLGMTKQGHFLHPSLPPEHRLALHVLYRLRR